MNCVWICLYQPTLNNIQPSVLLLLCNSFLSLLSKMIHMRLLSWGPYWQDDMPKVDISKQQNSCLHTKQTRLMGDCGHS